MNANIFYRNKDAVAIIRISSRRQADGLSPDVQVSEIEQYCKRLGLNLVHKFKIIESAKDSKARVKYNEAIHYVEKNKIGNVVFYMFDREARNFTDLEINEEKVMDGIFTLHYVKEGTILHKNSSEAEFLTRNFSGIINRQFSKTLSIKVNGGMKKKAESGWFPGNTPPLGYVCQKAIDPETGRIKNRGGIIVVDPNINNQRIVLREFELRSLGYSLERIREQVISEGLVSGKMVKSYSHSAIHYRLTNPFYRGEFYWQEVLYKGKHELFVPRNHLLKVEESFGLRGSTVKRKENDYTVLMGGWLKCTCGCHVVYDPKKKINRKSGKSKTYHYYHCTNGKRVHESMSGMSISNDQIWIQLEKAVDDIQISEALAEDIAEALNQLEAKAHSATRKQIEFLKHEEALFQGREDNLFSMRLNGEVDKETFDFQLSRIRKDRNFVIQQIESLQLSLTSVVMETVQSILELAKNAKSFWNSEPLEEKKKVLDMILSNPVLDGINIEYDLKKPFEILKEMKGNSEWRTRQDSNLRPTD